MQEADHYLHADLTHDAHLLPDAKQAADALLKAREAGIKIRIIGDYDVDGICSSYLLQEGLRYLNIDADIRLPERIKDGYGLNTGLIKEAMEDGVGLILTCDNGIAALDEALFAKENGLQLVVTDHHEVQRDEAGNELLPVAKAIVNPKREGSAYPFAGICGAVVAYRLLEVLYDMDHADKEPLKALDAFCALATVCDVMELTDENRGIVKHGLKAMEETSNAGLRALTDVTGLSGGTLSAYSLGFVLGPCLNASGRLKSAQMAVRLFQETDRAKAVQIATDLKALNDSRKEMTINAVERAKALLSEQEDQPRVLVVYLEDCHESIAGIIAGRLRELFHRPAIVLTDALSEDDAAPLLVKGSGRSVERYDMFAALSKCADLFEKFGGHTMAAGMTLQKDKIAELDRRLNDACTLTKEDLTPVLHIDTELPLSYVRPELLKEFTMLEPFGNGNPKPLFAARNVRFLRARRVGKTGSFAKYTVTQGADGATFTIMDFSDVEARTAFFDEAFGEGCAEALFTQGADREIMLHVAYEAQLNTFHGTTEAQIVLKDVRVP